MIYLVVRELRGETRDAVRAFTREADAEAFRALLFTYDAARPILGAADYIAAKARWEREHPAGKQFALSDDWEIDAVPLDAE